MTSINFSASASNAIRVLQTTNRDLDATQNRISTGLRVNSAKDDAIAFRTATALRSDVKTYDAIKSGMVSKAADLTAAAAGATEIASLLGDMKTQFSIAAAAASTTSADYLTATANIASIQNRIKSYLTEAAGDTNYLNGASATIKYTTGYQSSTGTLLTGSFTSLDLDDATAGVLGADVATTTGTASTSRSLLTFVAGATQNSTDAPLLQAAITAAITSVSNYASTLGSAADSINSAKGFLDKIGDIKKAAISSLVDANMEEESAKLSALQVKQQLATQALSIANQSGQNVLRLFQ